MGERSRPELRVLHAVRLLGFANIPAIASRAATTEEKTRTALRDFESRGWVREMSFVDLHGWSLTDSGRTENERMLAREREIADPHDLIPAIYRDFLPLNGRLLQACTDWQVKPTATDKHAPNDHSDWRWDARVLEELAALSEALPALNCRLTTLLDRFGGYDSRFEHALQRARDGELEWIADSTHDSCHLVWFQLHEDLVATLGIDRLTEDDRP